MSLCCGFFFKQKSAYEMRISDWSSDVCSSDLRQISDGKIITRNRTHLLQISGVANQYWLVNVVPSYFDEEEIEKELDYTVIIQIALPSGEKEINWFEIGRESCR